MALTPSNMPALGSLCPEFSLTDTISGKICSPQQAPSKPLLVMFVCNHCPYVIHIADALAKLGEDYQNRVDIIAINSNDATIYTDDAPELMPVQAQQWQWHFPYAFDADQSVAKAFKAACTPDFFLYNLQRELFYRGQLDDSRPIRRGPGDYDSSENQATGKDLRAALDAVLSGQDTPQPQHPSMGCNIKWK